MERHFALRLEELLDDAVLDPQIPAGMLDRLERFVEPFAACLVSSEQRRHVWEYVADTFDLPTGAVLLAQSGQCKHQAFRVGSSAWGLQFHIEMTPDMVDLWLSEPGNRDELAQLDYIDPAAIRAAMPSECPKMQQFGRRVLSRFATMCAWQAKE